MRTETLKHSSSSLPLTARWRTRVRKVPFFLYGVLLISTACLLYAVATIVGVALLVALGWPAFVSLALVTLGSVGPAVVAGSLLCLLDLFVMLPFKRRRNPLVRVDPVRNRTLTVVLTAYNDEESIGQSVQDFLGHPLVRRVMVIDNNSRDHTSDVAAAAGAEVVVEKSPGYGKCVHRALREGVTQPDTDLTLLCEGDMTFRAFDIDKFMSYIAHADIVNGTRIVEQLRARKTQLTTSMYYGNFVVGKLLELKHVGKGTFTDVGTTYKLCRNTALRHLLPHLNSDVNLEFNAHFLDTALAQSVSVVECPITFHNRVGVSKGGNTNNWRAMKVGMRMLKGILFSWKPA